MLAKPFAAQDCENLRKDGGVGIMAPALSASRTNKASSSVGLYLMKRRKGEPVSPVRINVWRLSIVFLLSTAVPLALSFLAIELFELSINVLLWVSIASIPLAAFTVSRALLAELDRVFQILAPEEPELSVADETDPMDTLLDRAA